MTKTVTYQRMGYSFIACLSTIIGLSCSDTTFDVVEDLENEGEISHEGKPDGFNLASCQIDELLKFVNSCEATTDALAASPYQLSEKARNSLAKKRDGKDALCGTEDDVLFADLIALDKVSWIGKKVITQLGNAFSEMCSTQPGGNDAIKVVFSPQPDEKSSHLQILVDLIDEAKATIDIAIYSFSNASIMSALERAQKRGVKIRFIYDTAQKDRKAPEGSRSAKLEALGINVRFVTLSKVMHHKFMIVDGPYSDLSQAKTGVLATGSGNWNAAAATKFDDNTLVVRGIPSLLIEFQREFNTLWNMSLDFVGDPSLPYEISRTIEPNDIPNVAGADVVFTTDNFDTTKTGFPYLRKRVGAERIAAEIATAKTSIQIASGHLRSWVITKALLDAKAKNPNLEIHVYLDQQEHRSNSVSQSQLTQFETCIATTGSDIVKEQECESGTLFAYALVKAGINVKFKYYAYQWEHAYADQMHHKYVILDGEKLITGSYNFSFNADSTTFENILVFSGVQFAPLVSSFKNNFQTIWKTGADKINTLIETIKTSANIPLVFDAMALTQTQLSDLRQLIRTNCPAVETKVFRENATTMRHCGSIQ